MAGRLEREECKKISRQPVLRPDPAGGALSVPPDLPSWCEGVRRPYPKNPTPLSLLGLELWSHEPRFAPLAVNPY